MAKLNDTYINGSLKVTSQINGSGGTFTGPVTFSGVTVTDSLKLANNKWNEIGDDVAIGDCNMAGMLGIKGLNTLNTSDYLTGFKFYHEKVTTNADSIYMKAHINAEDKASSFEFSHKVSAPTFCATSDKRLKENITPLKVEKSILDLPVYKYNFISDENKKEHIGCLAQDLQEICPEIVHESKDGYLSIEESKIVYLLLEEVKKLRKEIDELRR